MDMVIASIVSMGHSFEVAQKAAETTKSEDLNVNLEWIEKHLDDPEVKALLEKKMEVEENPEGQANKNDQAAQEWIPISGLVDQGLAAELQSMGFSKNVSEKALFMTQGSKSLDAALLWTEQHQNDPDYEEALLMQPGENSSKPKLSEQEARIKARELQNKLREDRKKREEQDEFEKEKKRILAGKSMGDAQREIQELKKRQDALQMKRQREQDAIDKQKMLDQLQRDREERFGKKAGGTQSGATTAAKKEPTPIEKFQVAIKQVKVAHPRNIFLDKAQVCLKTILTYVSNIIANPNEEKFRKINLENKAFQTRVADCFGAKDSLAFLGFVEEGTFLVCQSPNQAVLQQAVQILQTESETA